MTYDHLKFSCHELCKTVASTAEGVRVPARDLEVRPAELPVPKT